jgi:hypothetical protein
MFLHLTADSVATSNAGNREKFRRKILSRRKAASNIHHLPVLETARAFALIAQDIGSGWPRTCNLYSMTKSTRVAAAALLAILGGTVLCAQDLKYSLRSPGGIAFSDFKGYEDWSVASSARTEEVLKVIVANPAMIKAYKTGTPGNGQPFPEGSRIVKLQWKPKKSAVAPFRCL